MSLDLEKLQSYREGNRLEFKKAKGGLPRSFWETYSAFANTDGGLIVLGADEGADGSLVPLGISNVEAILKDLWNGLNNPERASANVLMDSDVSVQECEGLRLLLVHVPRASRYLRPVFVNNNPKTGTFRRNGEGDYHVTNDAYLSLVRDSMTDSIDTALLDEGFSLEDLNGDTIRAYRSIFKETRPGHPWIELPDVAFLVRIGAARRSGKDHEIHPTRAGLLMFGDAWRIVNEFPNYFLDCRQEIDGNRWNNRVVSNSGDWSGNVFDFWFKAYPMLSEGLPVPFRLAPGMQRIDDTPQHRAVREVLTNALVHADYFGRTGVVLVRKPDRIIASNPGTLRIALDEVEAGGVSDPRNETLLSMFSLLNIGERAGSGYDTLREGTYSAGKPDPLLEELWEPDRVRLTLELETSGLTDFRLPGMGGETSPLVTEIKPPRGDQVGDPVTKTSDQVNSNTDLVTDPVGSNTDLVTDQVGSNTDLVTDQVGSQVSHSTSNPVQELIAVLGNREMSISELMHELGLKHRPSFRERYLDPALEMGLIERTIPGKPTSSKQRYRRVKR